MQNPIKCFIQLQRPSDKRTSDPRHFEYIPMNAGRPFRSFKRLRNNNGLFHRILGLDNPLALPEENLLHKNSDNVAKTSPSKVPPSARMPSQPLLSGQPQPPRSPSKALLPSHPPTQTVDDIKQRMTANLDKKKIHFDSPALATSTNDNKVENLFTDDYSTLYSDNDIIDEVLSQGSANELLSVVGGLTVYEDVEALTQHGEVNPEAVDALYGDASYASCYSNFEFAMERMVAAANNASAAHSKAVDESVLNSPPPSLPPKSALRQPVIQQTSPSEIENDFNIYGCPSGRPIHPNKETLLKERGFNVPSPQPQKEVETSMVYAPVSDIMEEEEYKELSVEEIPQTILDLFV